jgi:dihydrodipicolinate synthase/N-acetylneuraminate lyase
LLKQKSQVLYAGIGSNCLQESIDLASFCFDAGVDVVVATLPTYYNLTESQIMKYFDNLANAIPGPLMIYNIPSTTHMSIPLPVIDQLSHHEKIVGIKDSERSDERLKQSLQLWAKRADFSYLIGWAARSVEALFDGADGIVPSSANLEDNLYWFLYTRVKDNCREEAMKYQKISDALGNIYQSGKTLGESLAALKVLMHHHKICESYVMPPLQRLSVEEEKKLIKAFDALRYEQ